MTDKTGETPAEGDEQPASTIETSEAREPSALERVTTERDEYLNTLQRLQAEFDNYRKRMLRQQTELLQRASEGVVERLLPVLDTLDLALAHSGD
ncbi:MAG TPA: nucleotide exchange factor GrpE, partial [Acidimicrobiales bacterium]|nr:nucleotide exchange factor GrpE [Acidimicrobiales bacterium]